MNSLGATDSSLPALTSGVSGLEVASLSAPRELEIPFVQTFAPEQVYQMPLTTGRIATLVSLFETVKFVSLRFAVEVHGKAGKLQFAATTASSAPTTNEGWLGATVYQRFSGNEQGDTYAEYVFPARHPFGRELKATVLGNDAPNFWFRFTGSTGNSAEIRGSLVIHGGGTGIIAAIPLAISKGG